MRLLMAPTFEKQWPKQAGRSTGFYKARQLRFSGNQSAKSQPNLHCEGLDRLNLGEFDETKNNAFE